MNETKNSPRNRIFSVLRQNWLLVFGVFLALAFNVGAVKEWSLSRRNHSVDEIENYKLVEQLSDTACLTSIGGVVLAVAIVLGREFLRMEGNYLSSLPSQPSDTTPPLLRSKQGYFSLYKPAWIARQKTGKGETIVVLLIVGILLWSSAVACFATILSGFNLPSNMKTIKLNGYTYHLAHHPTSDWDANEILLYECNGSDRDCHLVHKEFTRNLEHIDLRVDSETNSVLMVIYDEVVYVHPLP
ncbi:MAG TPA: hypothetical protein VHP83_19585 [Aggregatilineaceae bacterium]|nr:hypothetical protein [Aggregatilineaceae bacterium]